MNISVITINRNNAEGLRKTIESVVGQTERPFEFIIIDGASSDTSVETIHAFADSIDYWVSEPDTGVYNAMNKGIARAHGDYCIFMNSGDTFHSPSVLEQVRLSKANADIICGNTIYLYHTPIKGSAPPEITLDYLFNNPINHQSALSRTSLLNAHPFDESLKIVADRKFFLQSLIFDNCSYQAVDIDIANYDVGGLSTIHGMEREMEYARVLEDLFPPRIRLDYGRRTTGSLYGDTLYEKLFAEIGRRKWRWPVYHFVRGVFLCLAPFVKRARFVRDIK